ELGGCGQAEQLQAVGDDPDDQAAEHRINHLAAPAEQARPADDCGGDGVQHVRAAVDAAGDRAEIGGVDDPGDAGGQAAQRERRYPNPVRMDTGPPSRLGIAADRVDVAAEPGPAEQGGVDDQDPKHDQHYPGQTAHREQQSAAVGVADQHHDDASDRYHGDLEQGNAQWRG